MLAVFETGAKYEMFHALALLGLAALTASQKAETLHAASLHAAGWCFALGTCVFSFSLYALALNGIKVLGAVTPLGGLALLAGWLLLGFSVLKH